ncbi:YadA-like family protein [Escherichia coli]|uniref:YadA C-terminal domain-containing protein n=1 Tax=Escherichia coli TaxID=562 RepID=UPI00131D3398|nr:YadA C-terminal domain-containing protein [Escherichia coli]EFB6518155.1 adhesin [Escherichia coli]EHP9861444.1 YadA-like family protein [Escherichia coli]EHQ0035043.1 YadA-like family protein [Escherichia coli]EKD3061779.1 YadA-like family protein [Escherichia coli]
MSKKFTKTLLSSSLGGLLLGISSGVLAQELPPITDSDLPFYSVPKEADASSVIYGSTYRIYYNKSSGWGTMRYVLNGKDETLFNFDQEGNIIVLSKDNSIAYTVHEPVLKDFARMAAGLRTSDKENGKHQVDEEEVRRIFNKVNNLSNTVVNPALKNQVGELSSRTDIIDAATAANTNKIDSRTTVGVNADGTLTSADGATKTIAVNDGLVALSGRTDRIDAAVGSVDRRVTKNTQAIQSNTRQLQEHNARLNSQQRQIRENHEEMKRAAAQSAALAGLFQPYSVGKFNATAALGGYSDKQAVAVGVGYRFNEQTAAKAGVAASDGDVSYNVGVNFEF